MSVLKRIVWLTHNQFTDIYGTTKQNISRPIDNNLQDTELGEIRVVKNSFYNSNGKPSVKYIFYHNSLAHIFARKTKNYDDKRRNRFHSTLLQR